MYPDMLHTTEKICFFLKWSVKSLDWSPWIVLAIAWFSPTKTDLTEVCRETISPPPKFFLIIFHSFYCRTSHSHGRLWSSPQKWIKWCFVRPYSCSPISARWCTHILYAKSGTLSLSLPFSVFSLFFFSLSRVLTITIYFILRYKTKLPMFWILFVQYMVYSVSNSNFSCQRDLRITWAIFPYGRMQKRFFFSSFYYINIYIFSFYYINIFFFFCKNFIHSSLVILIEYGWCTRPIWSSMEAQSRGRGILWSKGEY